MQNSNCTAELHRYDYNLSNKLNNIGTVYYQLGIQHVAYQTNILIEVSADVKSF